MEKSNRAERLMINISDLELKVAILGNDLAQLNKEKERVKLTRGLMSTSESSSQASDRFEDRNEVLEKQIRMLEQENKNLSDDRQDWKQAYIDKAAECDSNREKYLREQQTTEQLRRQLEAACNVSSRDQEQVNTSLQLLNNRLKEQLEELGHLPFTLETTNAELQQTKSKLKLREKTIDALSVDLEACIVKCELLQKSCEEERTRTTKANQLAEGYRTELSGWEERYNDLQKKNELLLASVEKMQFYEESLEKKTELVQELHKQIERIKDENCKHVSRIRERAETQKQAFQSQMVGMQQELVQLRATLSANNKEREELKLRMQGEITTLENKFADAQLEIMNFKNEIEVLKSSYASIFEDDIEENIEGDEDQLMESDNRENSDSALSVLRHNLLK